MGQTSLGHVYAISSPSAPNCGPTGFGYANGGWATSGLIANANLPGFQIPVALCGATSTTPSGPQNAFGNSCGVARIYQQSVLANTNSGATMAGILGGVLGGSIGLTLLFVVVAASFGWGKPKTDHGMIRGGY